MTAEEIRSWFLTNQRDLPWRRNRTPYSVWVSEIMLQQTQVSVVIPYFYRWMGRFPTISDLASAPLDEVIKCWEGLGYYSRARNLHAAAQYLCAHHQGQLPYPIPKIKGLGPYTTGAISAFAFHKKSAAVDGNVMRVIARYYNLSDDISQAKTRRRMEALVHDLLPDERPWEVMEGLIELGATVCKPTPNCDACPLKGCARHTHLPYNSRETKITQLTRYVAVIISQDQVLLRRGKPGELMADLYEFPYFDSFDEVATLNLPVTHVASFPKVTHTFTRYRATLLPHQFTAPNPLRVAPYQWHPMASLSDLPFSSGHRKIMKFL